MATQQLIYETAVPVSRHYHSNYSVEAGNDYKFAAGLTSLPIMAVEFVQASTDYPIVFATDGETVAPVVILGVRENDNLFLKDDGQWDVPYIPAFVRRYPFVFAASEDEKSFTLCIDETWKGLNQDGRGQLLFADDGKPTEYVDGVLKFLENYRAQHELTRAFCEKLKSLDILEPMEARFTLESGSSLLLNGFLSVNRKKLQALSDEVMLDLARSDLLELIHVHLQSMRNFNQIKNRLILKDKKVETESAEEELAELAVTH